MRMRTQNKPQELQELERRSQAALATTRNIWLYKWDNKRMICRTRCLYNIWQKTRWPSGSTLAQSNSKSPSPCSPISNRSSPAWRASPPTNRRYATRRKQWQSLTTLSKKIQRVHQRRSLKSIRKIAWWTISNKACRRRMLARVEHQW